MHKHMYLILTHEVAVISVRVSIVSRVAQSDVMPKFVNLESHNERIRTAEDGRLTSDVGRCCHSAPVCCVGDDVHDLIEAADVDWGSLSLKNFCK